MPRHKDVVFVGSALRDLRAFPEDARRAAGFQLDLLQQGEQPMLKKVRFRTLGCWPLTAAIESDADSLEAVIAETFNARSSERQGRLIDSDVPGSMEKKKQEGYF